MAEGTLITRVGQKTPASLARHDTGTPYGSRVIDVGIEFRCPSVPLQLD
jgi:hypothetical protein